MFRDPLQIALDCLAAMPADPAAARYGDLDELVEAASTLADELRDVGSRLELNGLAIELGLSEHSQLEAELRRQIARHERCSRAHKLLDTYLQAIADATSQTTQRRRK